MDKSPDAFRTISEVADHLDTPAHVLRFWESRFPQIRPVKRAGGRRYYRPSDVALLAGIRRLLHEEGLTIRGVQKILREQGVRHVAGLTLAEPSDAMIEAQSVEIEGTVAEAGAVPEEIASEAEDDSFADEWEDDSVVEEAEVVLTTPAQPPAAVPAAPLDDLPLFATPRDDGDVPPAALPETQKSALTGLRALRAAKPAVESALVADAPMAEASLSPVDPQVTDVASVLARLRALTPGALAPHAKAIAVLSSRLETLRGAHGRPSRGSRG